MQDYVIVYVTQVPRHFQIIEFVFLRTVFQLKDIPIQVQEAAGLLLESKMFYVPFLLNSTISSARSEDLSMGGR